MNGQSKSIRTITGLTVLSAAAVVMLNISSFTSQPLDGFCGLGQSAGQAVDHSLPISHPANRCATELSQEVSWSSWFTGRSSSHPFHFIDLLELLSRSNNESKTHNPATTS